MTGPYARVYTLVGTRAHLLRRGGDPGDPYDNYASALCGLLPWPSYWRGLSRMGEPQQAADMPLCIKCAKLRKEHP